MTCWYMSFIILITCSFLVYLAEKSSSSTEDGKMVNLADGIYWGIVSLFLMVLWKCALQHTPLRAEQKPGPVLVFYVGNVLIRIYA